MRVLAFPGFSNRRTNPYNYLLYSGMCAEVLEFSIARALTGRFDVLHVHWPELELRYKPRLRAIWRLKRLFWIIDVLRSRGCKFFWTIHNLAPHEPLDPSLEGKFYDALLKRIDGYFVLSEAGLEAVQLRFPALTHIPGYVTPHGHYRGVYPLDPDADVRRSLDIPSDAKVILYFGKIKTYKNVPRLIEAFKNCEGANLILLIAGRPLDSRIEGEIRSLAEGDPRVRLCLRHIGDTQVASYFQASDLVVLPYREVFNSGTALLALSFDRPVVVPGVGAMAELRDIVGSEWVNTYKGEFGEHVLISAVEWACQASGRRCRGLDKFDWKAIADQTLQAYKAVASGPQSPQSRKEVGILSRRD